MVAVKLRNFIEKLYGLLLRAIEEDFDCFSRFSRCYHEEECYDWVSESGKSVTKRDKRDMR